MEGIWPNEVRLIRTGLDKRHPHPADRCLCVLVLAEDEKKHESYFRALKEKSALISVDSSVMELARDVFKAFDPERFEPEEDQIPLYREALAIEQRSIDLYKSQLNELEFEAEKEAIRTIIAEEERHYIVMEELLKLVTRPHRWVENAEFGVREEY